MEWESLQEKVSALELEIERMRRERQATAQSSSGLTVQFDGKVTAKIMDMLQTLIGVPSACSSEQSDQGNDALRSYLEQRPFYVVGVTGHSYPIIYASPAFATLTGYDMHGIIGRNCGFLHGPLTDKTEVGRSSLKVFS